MASFSNLKRNNSLDSLKKSLQSSANPSAVKGDDNRFWEPSVDKSGNGMAVIRFLPTPAVDGDDGSPWVQVFKHAFQGPGGWLIGECLTTVGDSCPVCEYNRELWNSGIESNKDVVRKQKRKLSYIANIYVVSDPANPGTEGKVYLFKFGKKIFDKISEAMNPPFADEQPINPFDLWEGANFKLKMRNVEGYRNYDKSEFEDPSALLDGDDDKLEALWRSEYSLKDFVDPTKMPSPEKLRNRLDVVLGRGRSAPKVSAVTVEDTLDIDEDIPDFDTQKTQRIAASSVSSSDDDDMDFFRRIAEED